MGPEERDTIEGRADAVLGELRDYLWSERKPPVPVECVAEDHFGLRVVDKPPAELRAAPGCPPLDPDDRLSGLLLPSLSEIWVNAEESDEWPPRRRFTIAHEIGHWVMHRGQQTLFCRSKAVQPESDATGPDIEEEASVFAAALLMPRALMQSYWPRIQDHGRMCEVFDTSRAAMGKRLHSAL